MHAAGPFKCGDVVVHRLRPEWGDGVVRKVQRLAPSQEGVQRLLVDFAHRGPVTLHTGMAPLVMKTATVARPAQETGSEMTTHTTQNSRGWLAALEQRTQTGNPLTQLPESMTDPFLSNLRRLQATLDSYRYSREPRSLIEWAIVQTGLTDPLSRYTRSELEQAFPFYCGTRDNHLRDLVRQMKRNGELSTLNRVLSETRLPAAQRALQQAMKA
jgi:hypothetical protein